MKSMKHKRLLLSNVAPCCQICVSSRRQNFGQCFSTSLRRPHQPKALLPDGPARTRFAPSPTGYLHLGSLRTALFSYLLAKKTGGQFLLRIEDTDERRTVPGAEQRLCEDLQWAGIQWDEGPLIGGPYGPYKQSERTSLYKGYAQKLLDSGHAYRCFCSLQRLDQLARLRQSLGLPTDYDRTCEGILKEESADRALKGEAHVVRLKVPEKYPEFRDLIYGKIGRDKGDNLGITMKHGEVAYEDPVLLKTDGRPTYHLANVVDDHHMEITHVVRATEWISSTPKHLALYEAFGWTPPTFAHVGLLVDEAGRKLSKRNFDTDIANFRNMGVLPETLVNFVALLGWSHEQKSDVMNLEQLVENFRMKFTKGNTIVTLDKLWFLQRRHAAKVADSETPSFHNMCARSVSCVESTVSSDELIPILHGRDLKLFVSAILKADGLNYTTPEHFVERNIHFFTTPEWRPYEQDVFEVDLAAVREGVKSLIYDDSNGRHWNTEMLEGRLHNLVTEVKARPTSPGLNEKISAKQWRKEFYHYLRWVLFDGKQGPGLASAMAILGRDVCQERFDRAMMVEKKEQLEQLDD